MGGMPPAKTKRRFPRFSLRTFLVFMLLLGVLLAWLAALFERNRRQWAVRSELGVSEVRFMAASHPFDCRARVRFVEVFDSTFTDSDLARLTNRLETHPVSWLYIGGIGATRNGSVVFGTQVTDKGFAVRGKVWHPDHATIRLDVWHRVEMNTENRSRAMASVAFLD
jgi:hypothetical protein